MAATFFSGRKTSCSRTISVRELMMHRQIEMFAGVAASSMPTVKQFFSRQNLSLTSWRSSVKFRLSHLLSSSVRVKLTDENPSFTDWGGIDTHAPEDHEGLRMKDLESDGYERKAAKARRARDS